MFVNAQTGALDRAMVWTTPRKRGLRSLYERSGMNKQLYGVSLLASAMAAMLTITACNQAPQVAERVSAPPPPALTAPTAAPLANVADIDVTEHVRMALAGSEALKGFNIDVITLKGDVRLIGVLRSQAQIDEAIRIARASDGAHSVHDELTIKK
jgi:hyperosmotically inducible protein